MRVNVYAEEMTDRVEIISKEIEGTTFTGLRLYLELPATVNGENVSGPFMHRPGDDDSAAVTFWGKRDLRKVLHLMLAKLDEHYDRPAAPGSMITRKFDTKALREQGLPYEAPEGGAIISDTISGTSRWSVQHELIFRFEEDAIGDAWLVRYQVGATESQDEGPWEYEDEVVATLVREVEKTVKVWEPVEEVPRG